MKNLILVLGLGACIFSACSSDDENLKGKGTVTLSITDAPSDDDNIAAVYITINGVSYRQNGEWYNWEDFGEPEKINLLDLTNGKAELLGGFEVEGGEYTELRLHLDSDPNGGNPESVATYLEFKDGSVEPLYVPSGTSSGYKAKGEFLVPVNGNVFITADFDVRKSVVKAGNSGKYILKPVIRLVVENQAGFIEGVYPISENDNADYIVYAYEDGTYSESEADEPAETENRFMNATTSARLDNEGNFVLAYLAEGRYDLILVKLIDGAFEEVTEIKEDVVVSATETTKVTL